MLDQFSIFTRGGILLWSKTFAPVKGDPLNALIRTCLLEDRTGEASFSYVSSLGGSYTIKWTLNNKLGLVYAAIYQKNLKIGYVESLLQKVDRAFSKEYADEKNVPIGFEDSFMVLLEDAEREKKEAAFQPKKGKQEEQQRQQENEAADTGAEEELVDEVEIGKAGEGEDGPAFNAEVLKKKMLGKKGGAPTIQPKKGDAKKKGKKARQWNDFGIEQSVPETNLDFTEGAPPEEATMQQQVESFQQMSLMDVEEEVSDVELEEDEPSGGKSSSLLSSFVRNIGVNVMGTQALSREDIDPSLQDLKKKLMERNVAEEIANKCVIISKNCV